MKETAVIMAAGKGMRMRPLTEKRPKPLIQVKGIPMIETVINGLEKRGVDKIYIVTGYLKEQFIYLEEKYGNVKCIVNQEYDIKNNISSLKAVREYIGKENCFVCEADLYIADSDIFLRELPHSCYYGKMVQGYSDDWVFHQNGETISEIAVGGVDCYNMAGISYWRAKDIQLISDKIEEAYQKSGHEKMYWDEIVNQCLLKLDVWVEPVLPGQVVELDTVEELAAFEAGKMLLDKEDISGI